jgi:hypothetical protein
VLKSGNREAEQEEKTVSPTIAVQQEIKIETPPFRKPQTVVHERMKVTSIKDVLAKNTSPTASDNNSTDTNREENLIQQQQANQPQTEIDAVTVSNKDPENNPPLFNPEQETKPKSESETETVFTTLEACWEEAVKESSPQNMIAQSLLLKQIPVEIGDHLIEIEVSSEIMKQEVKEVLPTLTQCINKKTGISYTIEIKIIRVIHERKINKINPDEKFQSMCEENPKLLEFQQRLNLTIS